LSTFFDNIQSLRHFHDAISEFSSLFYTKRLLTINLLSSFVSQENPKFRHDLNLKRSRLLKKIGRGAFAFGRLERDTIKKLSCDKKRSWIFWRNNPKPKDRKKNIHFYTFQSSFTFLLISCFSLLKGLREAIFCDPFKNKLQCLNCVSSKTIPCLGLSN